MIFTEEMIRRSLDANGVVYEHTHPTVNRVHAVVDSEEERERLREFKRDGMPRTVPDELKPLLEAVAKLHGTKTAEIMNLKGEPFVNNARAHFIYELARRTKLTKTAIGKLFGRDHDHAKYYLNKVKRDQHIYDIKVEKLKELLP